MGKFGVKEVMDVTFYDLSTKRPVLFLDTLKMSNIENTAEEVSARGGRGNPELLIWDFNREATMAIQDALLSPKSFELLSGNAVLQQATPVMLRQDTEWEAGSDRGEFFPLVADEYGEFTLAFDPIDENFDPAGSTDGVLVYAYNDDGGDPLSIVSVVGTTVTLDSGEVNEGDRVVAYFEYLSDATSEIYQITSNAFPGTYKIVGDTVVRNMNGIDEPFQVVIERAKLLAPFTLTFQAEGDPSVFDMNIKIMREEDNPGMIKMIKY